MHTVTASSPLRSTVAKRASYRLLVHPLLAGLFLLLQRLECVTPFICSARLSVMPGYLMSETCFVVAVRACYHWLSAALAVGLLESAVLASAEIFVSCGQVIPAFYGFVFLPLLVSGRVLLVFDSSLKLNPNTGAFHLLSALVSAKCLMLVRLNSAPHKGQQTELVNTAGILSS